MIKNKDGKSAKPATDPAATSKSSRAVPKGKHQPENGAAHANGKSRQPQTESTTQKAEKPSAGGLPERSPAPVHTATIGTEPPAGAKVPATALPRNSKQEAVIALLIASKGTTINAINGRDIAVED